jgi:hypothetical protein
LGICHLGDIKCDPESWPPLPSSWGDIEADAVSFRKRLVSPGSPLLSWKAAAVYTFASTNLQAARQELQQFLGGFLGVDRADNTPVDEAAVFLAILGSHVNISEREWGMKWHGGHGPRPIAGTIAQGLLSGPLFFQESGCQLNRLNTAPQKILAAGHNPQVLGLIMLRSGSVSQHRRYELAAMCGRSTFSGILPWLVDACPSCGNVTGHKSVQARRCPMSTTMLASRGHRIVCYKKKRALQYPKPPKYTWDPQTMKYKKPLDVAVVDAVWLPNGPKQ